MEFKIENDVPVPPIRGADSALRKAIRKMKPGACLTAPAIHRGSITSAAKDIFGKGNYTTRKSGRSFRLWRLK